MRHGFLSVRAFFSSLFFFNFTTRNKTQQSVTTTREINAYNNPRKCEMKKDLMWEKKREEIESKILFYIHKHFFFLYHALFLSLHHSFLLLYSSILNRIIMKDRCLSVSLFDKRIRWKLKAKKKDFLLEWKISLAQFK